MRLFERLLISHTLPVLVVSVALVVVLGAIFRMTQLARELGEGELRTLAREGALHQAAWNLDLAMRDAVVRCSSGDARTAEEEVRRQTTVLRRRLVDTDPVTAELQRLSASYLELGERLLERGVCGDAAAAIEQARTEVDAHITTIWVQRLDELHTAARVQETEVGQLGTSALVVGLLLALLALGLALGTARRMAGEISAPLAEIARVARRLSSGDFGESLRIEGATEIVELAEELERMRVRLAELESLKQGFLASVSHELRTPLSKIREALALLSDGACGPLQDRQSRVVDIARVACEREIRIVTQMLDLSRLRAGAPLRLRSNASIDDTLHSAVAEEKAEAQSRKVTIELCGTAPQARTALDETLMERAFANLVRNAVSVSKAGQTVRVERSIETVGDERFAVVRVRDEGPGVPSEVRETLFHPFVTVSVHGSPKAVGIGLGLALSREVARAHGGDVTLEPIAERGACFVVRLPLDRKPPTPERSSASLAFAVAGDSL